MQIRANPSWLVATTGTLIALSPVFSMQMGQFSRPGGPPVQLIRVWRAVSRAHLPPYNQIELTRGKLYYNPQQSHQP